MEMTAPLYLLIVLAIAIIVFLICREIVMWYWKINERIKLQKETQALLAKQNKILEAQLNLLAGMSDKLGVPVSDINEVVNEFGIEYE